MENDKSQKLVEEWVLKAKDDELSAKDILNDKEGAPSTVCFLSQQIAEKFLKAYLISREIEFPKIHDLDKLVELCKKSDTSFDELKDNARMLADFYISTRYPGDYPQFTWKDAEQAFDSASKIKQFILEKISY